MFVAYFTLPMNRDRISVASQGDVFNELIFINQFDDFITTISSSLHYNSSWFTVYTGKIYPDIFSILVIGSFYFFKMNIKEKWIRQSHTFVYHY